MTQKQENALKILYRLKNEEHINFEEYFTLIESIIGENKTEYYPVTYNPYPWLDSVYSKDITGIPYYYDLFTTTSYDTIYNGEMIYG